MGPAVRSDRRERGAIALGTLPVLRSAPRARMLIIGPNYHRLRSCLAALAGALTAVAATAGQIVTYAGRPAITYFFASSGGRTENVETAFPGSLPEPWLRGVLDPYDGGPLHSWTLTLSFSSAAARLGGLVRGRFQGIEVLSRGFSPRIVSAYVLGSGGRTLVGGAELAARLGLYDSWAYFSVREGASV